MLQRIQELMAERKLTASQFADEIGIQRSGMSHLLSGRNKPSLDFILKVLNRFPDISPEWLLLGTIRKSENKEPVKTLPAEDAKRLTLFDQVDLETGPAIKPEKPARKETSGRRIEKIVVFYNDLTFREYNPEM